MTPRERVDATSLIRRASSRSSAGTELAITCSTEPSTVSQAIAELSPKPMPGSRVLTVFKDLSAARQRARQDAALRLQALEHEADLRRKSLAIHAARIERELDIYSNEQHATLNARLLASLGELLQTMEAVRSSIEMGMAEDRHAIIQQIADAHEAGRFSDDERDARVERVLARFEANDKRIAAETDRCIEDASRLLRKARV